MNFDEKISGKSSVISGLILILSSSIGLKYFQGSDLIYFISVLIFPCGLFIAGMASAKLYFEPVGRAMALDQLSQEHPIQIPDNNIRGTNLFLSWTVGFSILLSIFLFKINSNISIALWVLCLITISLVLNTRSRKYFVYPDRLQLLIGFPMKIVTDVYFKDITSISKTRIVPYSWSGMPLRSYDITNTRISTLNSLESEISGAATKDYYGAGILIILKNSKVLLLPSVLYPDNTVEKLKKLAGLS